MIDILYIFGFFISYIILDLFKKDIKILKLDFYEKINYKIWLKIYAFITIIYIHLIWLLSTLLLNYNDNNIIYGIPLYIFISYTIYLFAELKIDKNETNISYKINKILNYLMLLYITIIIIFIIFPNDIKISFFNCIKNIIKDFMNKQN
jgi:hypothetical protein